jgi:predicted DNA-binding helix-hairpin-helix protein
VVREFLFDLGSLLRQGHFQTISYMIEFMCVAFMYVLLSGFCIYQCAEVIGKSMLSYDLVKYKIACVW